jgi:hypothetical protein
MRSSSNAAPFFPYCRPGRLTETAFGLHTRPDDRPSALHFISGPSFQSLIAPIILHLRRHRELSHKKRFAHAPLLAARYQLRNAAIEAIKIRALGSRHRLLTSTGFISLSYSASHTDYTETPRAHQKISPSCHVCSSFTRHTIPMAITAIDVTLAEEPPSMRSLPAIASPDGGHIADISPPTARV